MTVWATDTGGLSDTIDVTIDVTNVDEEGTVSLSTQQPLVGTQLTTTLTDPDEVLATLATTWQWASGDSPTPTAWTPINGAAAASYTPVDADMDKYLRATASYTDGQGPSKSAEAVSANAVRAAPPTNEPPEFPSTGNYDRGVAENKARGQNIGVPVTAIDANSDTLTYGLISGTDAASFAIVASSGQLLTKGALDFESKNSYTVKVAATDPSDESADITVTINVTDVEEAGTVSLSPSPPRVGRSVTATLTDPDGGVTGQTWEWERSDDGNTGWAVVGTAVNTYTVVSADAGKYLRATVTYTDRRSAGQTASAQAGPVTRPPPPRVVNTPPRFPTDSTTRSVDENAANTNVGSPVRATDSQGQTLRYTLEGAGAAAFSIVRQSGQLRTKASLDYETKSSHAVTVRATDTGGLSDTIAVTINVTNVEEPGRVSLSPAHPQVGTELTATLTDPDGSLSGVTWQWASSADKSDWTPITGQTAATYTPVAGDLGNFLRATASYTDGHDSGKTAEGVTEIAVQPSGDNTPPVFPDAETRARSVAENTPAGENVGDPVTATDADTDDTLTYSLGGTDAESFDIEAATGQLRTRAALDYETRNSYSLTVSVNDGKDAGGAADVAADTTIELTVAVTDVKEVPGRPAAPTVEADSTRRLSVTWQEPDNTGPPINGYDVEYRPRGGDSEVKEETTPGGSRTLTVRGLEAGTAYEARVRARNAEGDGEWSPWGSGNTRRVVSRRSSRGGGGWVSPAPESNRPPVFTEGESTERWAAEQTTVGTHIGPPVAATDLDGDPLTYSLAGFTGPFFSMDRHTGQLKVRAALDFDVEPSYTGIVNVSDGRGGSDSIVLNITVVEVPVVGSPAPSPTATPVAMGEPTATPTLTATPTPTPKVWPLAVFDPMPPDDPGGVSAPTTTPLATPPPAG